MLKNYFLPKILPKKPTFFFEDSSAGASSFSSTGATAFSSAGAGSVTGADAVAVTSTFRGSTSSMGVSVTFGSAIVSEASSTFSTLGSLFFLFF